MGKLNALFENDEVPIEFTIADQDGLPVDMTGGSGVFRYQFDGGAWVERQDTDPGEPWIDKAAGVGEYRFQNSELVAGRLRGRRTHLE